MREKIALSAIASAAALIVLPAFIVAVALYWRAWSRGWTPTRVRYIAAGAWALPVATWLSGSSPWEMVNQAGDMADNGPVTMAWLPLLPWMLPLGVTMGALYWSRRWYAARAGQHRNPRAAGVWAARQWNHAMLRARREARYPGLVPLTDRRGGHVIGRAAQIVQAGAGNRIPPDPRKLVLPPRSLSDHLVVIGEPGAGKTVTLNRVMASFLEAAWRSHVEDGSPRPLLILANCKGGREGVEVEAEFVAMCEAQGIRRERIGVWPREVRFDLWTLPAQRLVEVLVEMVKTDHPYYADVQDEAVGLAVLAPSGPPTSSVDFVSRLNSDWLLDQYDGRFPGERESIKQLRQEFAGVASRYRSTFRRLGRQLDSGRHLSDFDAIVCTVEGTSNARTAAAQAQALVELVTDLATTGGPRGERRKVLFVVDEFSAVSERVSMTKLMERTRSLGVGVVPAGQSWASMGPSDDERRRLIAAAAGGMLVMATTDPDDLVKLAGSQLVVEVGLKKLDDGSYGDEGSGRVQNAYLVDPDRLRLAGQYRGQVVYISHGTATWGVVAPAATASHGPMIPLPLPGRRLRAVVEQNQRETITAGDRIPIAQLEDGLTRLDRVAPESSNDEFSSGQGV